MLNSSSVFLFIPPYTPPMIPNLGTSLLAGYLSSKRVDGQQMDLNILFHNEILENGPLLRAAANYYRSEDHLMDRKAGFDSNEAGDHDNRYSRMNRINEMISDLPTIVSECFTPISEHDPLPFGYPGQKKAFQLVDEVLSLFQVDSMKLNKSLPSTFSPIEGRKANILESFYDKHISRLEITKDSVLGISILYPGQFGFALLLCRYLRHRFPNNLLVTGGPGSSAYYQECKMMNMAGCCDYVVTGEGERVLGRLSAEGIRKRNTKQTSAAFRKGIPISRFPDPVFNPNELPMYWSVPLILPIQLSRGCYWRRCAFCRYHTCYSGGYRLMSPARAAGMISRLQRKYQCTGFQMVDDCLPPLLLSRLADHLFKESISVEWTASVRFEPEFDCRLLKKLASAGCIRLTFGMETANQQLLNYIRKGTHVRHYLPTLKNCKEAGINVHLNWIAGLPTETPRQLETTIDFLVSHKHLYQYQFGHVFAMEPGSPFTSEPEEFNLPANVGEKEFHSPSRKEHLKSVIHRVARLVTGN